MDLYTMERDHLARHRAMIHLAERRAAIMADTPKPALAAWLAGGLRRAADRLDPRPSLDSQRPAIVRSMRRPAP